MTDKNHLTPLVEMSTMFHEIYLAYVEAGFTEDQSFQLVNSMLTTLLIETGGNFKSS